MRKFWTLLIREVRSYFYSPIAYIVMIFFLIISGIDFYFQVSFMRRTAHATCTRRSSPAIARSGRR